MEFIELVFENVPDHALKMTMSRIKDGSLRSDGSRKVPDDFAFANKFGCEETRKGFRTLTAVFTRR